ncbi:LacI family transcriptional regulator [Kribbella voronezhensis]|uniref:LacI family transcriptional regulator n=1 Tax=Kribbella voronezhensis TaxID=2512212 RepID=A0A4R7SWU8_9ACTN|nr:LacI family DNA-binding transcriptional regulator [Kribbella voronezhensis]TDU83435.1 LacI family transcriptional regulator [Kribbella voronezhensis]
MATPSIKEVAQHAGVSVGTVSNVLNRPSIVAPKTRQRVLDTIRELGFVRNEAARHLRLGRGRTVGLVVFDVANPFFTDLAEGADEVAYEHDIVVMLCNSKTDPVREGHHLDQLEQQRVFGILITPYDSTDPGLHALVARGTPVVLVDRTADSGLCSVSVDDQVGGRLAGQHLIESGHRRIAFIGGPLGMQQVADRLAGITGTVEKAGDVELQTFEVAVMGVAHGREAGEKIAALPRRSRPTAAFCGNDLLALGFLQAMAAAGLRVPQDMAIVGYDDIGFAAAAAVPLSSVRQPAGQLGRTAMQLLQEEVEDAERHSHRQVIFQPDLVVRQSSDYTRD